MGEKMSKVEQTLVLIKPDAVARGLIGKITSMIEEKGLKISAMKLMRLSDAKAKEHYKEHVGKPFFEPLISFITSSPLVAMVVEGRDAIKVTRALSGATNPMNAAFGTVRGRFALETGRNVMHTSDGEKSAKREIAVFFDESEILSYETVHEKWLYE